MGAYDHCRTNLRLDVMHAARVLGPYDPLLQSEASS